MLKRNILFSPPDISELEIKEVADALRSGWITTGPRTKELERKIAKFCEVDRAVCLNSQTACAEMALRILGIGEGDEVIVPSYTYTASASVVYHVGAKIVFVDVQKDSLEMDYEKMAEAITEKTKAIIPVDLAGIPCDYDKIFAIVENKKHLFKPNNDIQKAIGRIAICADAAHAFGASCKGRKVGSIADFTSFSFHAVKNLTTAEGGALTWRNIEGIDNEDIYHQLQLFSLHGQSKDALAKTQLGAWEYDIKGPWYKCNMTDILAGVGLAQLSRYEGMLARRKEIIEKYDNAFKPLGVKTLNHYTDEYQSSGHLYLTRIPNISLEQRQEIIVKMAEAGIACNVHYKPLPMMTAYINLGFDIKDYPNSYEQFANEITLPLHTCLTDEDVDYIIENYKRIVKEYV
ncbi:DegT/DnrJ/EryC1/StrS family aminotransferase [Fusobacterium perfoetens]|uniref:DegT/DnrJ/EryC1/StrS family aminotransferase n=1 Tax=Fusobacterium perfoetens TaxID=852 RepID=UPI001F453E40|nr:DegT/DnrJ/EryC1/StrS family aminotransferase [Fusobacterium perfoetens]MCF2613307.1 DegT/DnrJ/EryC1/StrS family aminotransferase [Fusobacterium perfoetens]